MCFFRDGKQGQPEIAKKDIVAYKLICRVVDDKRFSDNFKITAKKGNFITPYRYAIVELGETYTTEFSAEEIDRDFSGINFGLHAYTTKQEAINERHYAGTVYCHTVLVKVVIPKGTRYFKNELDQIVAEKIIYSKRGTILERYVPVY